MNRFKAVIRWILCAIGAYFIIAIVLAKLVLSFMGQPSSQEEMPFWKAALISHVPIFLLGGVFGYLLGRKKQVK